MKELLKANISTQISGEYTQPMIISGHPGTNKSTMMKEIAKELGYEFHYYSIPSLPAEMLSGLPSFVELEDGVKGTTWSIPEIVLRANESDKPVIISLEDIHAINESLVSYLYEILVEKKLGFHKLKKEVAIVGTMNNTEAAGYEGFPSAVMNRISIIEHELTYEEWFKEFGFTCDPYVTSFLASNKGKFQEEENTMSQFGTPRSYTGISNIIKNLRNTMGDNFEKYFDENVYKIAPGYMSKDAAMEFTKHIKYLINIDFDKILKEKKDLDLKTAKEQIIMPYMINYIKEKDDARFFMEQLEKNMNKSMFFNIAMSNLYINRHKNDAMKFISMSIVDPDSIDDPIIVSKKLMDKISDVILFITG